MCPCETFVRERFPRVGDREKKAGGPFPKKEEKKFLASNVRGPNSTVKEETRLFLAPSSSQGIVLFFFALSKLKAFLTARRGQGKRRKSHLFLIILLSSFFFAAVTLDERTNDFFPFSSEISHVFSPRGTEHHCCDEDFLSSFPLLLSLFLVFIF